MILKKEGLKTYLRIKRVLFGDADKVAYVHRSTECKMKFGKDDEQN